MPDKHLPGGCTNDEIDRALTANQSKYCDCEVCDSYIAESDFWTHCPRCGRIICDACIQAVGRTSQAIALYPICVECYPDGR